MDQEISRARRLASDAQRRGGRAMLGITGPPGAGKSTLAASLATQLGQSIAAYVPMDGFHLGDALLRTMGLRDRKGAPDTFDSSGYAHLLSRLRAADEVVYAPLFDRAAEDSVAAALRIEAAVPLIITEGNYLLEWPRVRAALDEIWYLDPPSRVRLDRLAARHRRYGKSPAEAAHWAGVVDERNAQLIARHRADADIVIR